MVFSAPYRIVMSPYEIYTVKEAANYINLYQSKSYPINSDIF
jgi:hypothetical protein